MIILSSIYGIIGVLVAGPVADGIAFVLAVILLSVEVHQLKPNSKQIQEHTSKIKNEKENNSNVIITIAREYGSGGRYIGKLVAEKLGIKLYDKNIIELMSESTGLSSEYIKDNEQKRTIFDNFNQGYYAGLNNSDDLFIKESKLIEEIAEQGSCVIVGRCANYILKDRKNVITIFINNSLENKIERATKFYGFDKEKAEKEITRINKLRANHYEYYTEQTWNDPSNYDICINSDAIGIDNAVNLICDFVRNHN